MLEQRNATDLVEVAIQKVALGLAPESRVSTRARRFPHLLRQLDPGGTQRRSELLERPLVEVRIDEQRFVFALGDLARRRASPSACSRRRGVIAVVDGQSAMRILDVVTGLRATRRQCSRHAPRRDRGAVRREDLPASCDLPRLRHRRCRRAGCARARRPRAGRAILHVPAKSNALDATLDACLQMNRHDAGSICSTLVAVKSRIDAKENRRTHATVDHRMVGARGFEPPTSASRRSALPG